MFTSSRLFAVFVALFCTLNASTSVAHNILMLTIPAKSHVFPILAIGDGLTVRDHEITVLIAKSLHIDVKNSVGRRIERYEDNGTDYEELYEKFTSMSMGDGNVMKQVRAMSHE